MVYGGLAAVAFLAAAVISQPATDILPGRTDYRSNYGTGAVMKTQLRRDETSKTRPDTWMDEWADKLIQKFGVVDQDGIEREGTLDNCLANLTCFKNKTHKLKDNLDENPNDPRANIDYAKHLLNLANELPQSSEWRHTLLLKSHETYGNAINLLKGKCELDREEYVSLPGDQRGKLEYRNRSDAFEGHGLTSLVLAYQLGDENKELKYLKIALNSFYRSIKCNPIYDREFDKK